MRSNEELDVAEGERSCIGRGVCVFARAKQIEEGDDNHVCSCLQEGGLGRESLGDLTNVADDGNWNGLDPLWRRITLFPCLEHTLDAKIDFVGCVQTRVLFPQ